MIKLFISYAREDEDHKIELEKRLVPLKRSGVIEEWNDRLILPGEDWDHLIKDKIENSDIILFLISPDFIASDYIYDVEIARAMDRYRKREIMIIPVIIRPTDYSGLELSKFQAVPKDGRPISTWENQDEAWHDAILQLKRVFDLFNKGKVNLNKSEPTLSSPQTFADTDNIKTRVKDLMANARIDQAINALLDHSKSANNNELFNQIILLSARYKSLKKRELMGVISFGEASTTQAQIAHALLSILNEV